MIDQVHIEACAGDDDCTCRYLTEETPIDDEVTARLWDRLPISRDEAAQLRGREIAMAGLLLMNKLAVLDGDVMRPATWEEQWDANQRRRTRG